jgi:hypothetical protein
LDRAVDGTDESSLAVNGTDKSLLASEGKVNAQTKVGFTRKALLMAQMKAGLI